MEKEVIYMTVKESLFNSLNEINEKMNLGRIKVNDPNDLTYMDYWNGFKAITDLLYAAAVYDGDYEMASCMLSVVNKLVKLKRICELLDLINVDRIELSEIHLNLNNLN